jgi:hypothetical protein
MHDIGWRANEPAFGVWDSSRNCFIVLGGNHRTAGARIAGVCQGRAVTQACVRSIETDHPAPERDIAFLVSLAIAVQAPEHSPGDFSLYEHLDMLSKWVLQGNGSRLDLSASAIHRL